MKLSEIVKALDATLLAGEDKLDKIITRCGASDLMSDVLAAVSEDCLQRRAGDGGTGEL